uniref:Secreted protein n=1 Tax=Arundo donax TaxID=35708 RepID=A0A0A8ZHV0_ARUDO
MSLSLVLLFLALKVVLRKMTRRRASNNRMAIAPKNTPNASANTTILLCCFLEVEGAISELQW